jgi:putative hemolysin
MEYLELAVVGLLVLVNGIFAAYEIGLASVSISRLQYLVSQQRRGAAAALRMKAGIEKSFAVVQLGITLVGLTAGATSGASASDDLAPLLRQWGLGVASANLVAIVILVVPLTAITIVVGELIPKLFALRNKEWVCLTLSPVMSCFSLSVWPVVWFLEFSASGLMALLEKLWRPQFHADTRLEAIELQELRAIASMARTSRLIGPREENIILGAARLSSRPIEEIFLPAEHIRMLCLDDSLAESLVAAHLDLHTRFPVCQTRHDPQTIVGYVTFKDIVSALKLSPLEPSLRGILRQIPSLSASTPIASALEFLLKERTHISLVRNPADAILGMITLEDIVEELVGDIQDEHDLLPVHVIRSGRGWLAGGGVTLARLHELTGMDLGFTGPTPNLSAWITSRLGAAPRGGDVIQDGPHRVLVRKVRRQRVMEAHVTLLEALTPAAPANSSAAPSAASRDVSHEADSA